MRIAWVTDCHLDRAGPPAVARFLEALREASTDAVIVTGDVSHAQRLIGDLEAIHAAAAAPVWHVLGNHDHYGGGVGSVRDAALALADAAPAIAWLPPAGVVDLGAGRRLVGVDGWADGRHGDPMHTPLVLNDDRLIAELAAHDSRAAKLTVKRVLADADADRLATLLDRAAATDPIEIVVATHVPPFVEALAPGSRESHPDWHPLLVCGATGRVLRRFATDHPNIALEVLAGHSHRGHRATILPNLTVRVGEARYGAPNVVTLEVGR